MNPRNAIKNIVPLEVPPTNPSTPIYVNKTNGNKKGPIIPTFNFHKYKCFKKINYNIQKKWLKLQREVNNLQSPWNEHMFKLWW
jgi:hypothetical protein